MTKRTTASGLPRRERGKVLADAQAPVVRCTATEGAQQCMAAAHSKMQNHRWGPTGETDQWTAEGIAKPPDGQFETAVPGRHGEDITPDPCGYVLRTSHGNTWGTCILPEGHDGDHELLNPADVLAVSPPPGDGEADDPPATPSAGDALEPSAGVPAPQAAGSGGGSGRPLVRPDAGEAVLAAAGGVINPAAEPGLAITLAEEFARLMVLGKHFGNMLQANADKRLVAAKDVRAVYHKMRQIAATHGIDLDDEGAGS